MSPLLTRAIHVAVLAAAATACGGGDDDGHHAEPDAAVDCEAETRDEEYFAGMSKTGPGGYTVTLADALPSPPGRAVNAWSVTVTDPDGAPATAISVATRMCMPDHDHGSPVTPTVTPDGAGGFQIEGINFWMPTLWDIGILVREADAADDLPTGPCDPVPEAQRLDAVQFRFCIE